MCAFLWEVWVRGVRGARLVFTRSASGKFHRVMFSSHFSHIFFLEIFLTLVDEGAVFRGDNVSFLTIQFWMILNEENT